MKMKEYIKEHKILMDGAMAPIMQQNTMGLFLNMQI